ncbi:hypothetical protein FOZ60_008408 [Perkinsus olseni]|uniref:Uncharacterized protein n=1 Tax=Perkinsus olseni TaxID=32597 RepID=A0A7J6NJ74_PEROL|nr:hypothetical protein FOZ60_008408 [Perkinsus olseni]
MSLFAAILPSLRPVRWLTPDETDIDQAKWSKFVAFGYGPRQCPGKHLAMKEMIVFAAYLLRYFDNIRLGEGCKIEDKYTTFLGMHQKDFYVAMDAGRKAAISNCPIDLLTESSRQSSQRSGDC